MTITIISVLSLLAVLFSMCTVIFSIMAYCKVVGLENSTHQIQYMPVQEYGSFQEAVEKNEDKYTDMRGLPITDPEEKEKKRQEKLLEGFSAMYSEE